MVKPFYIQFKEYKESISGRYSLYDEAFLYWVKNYVNQGKEFNPYNFLMGKIYSFEYLDRLEKNKKFINKRPVVFFTGFFNPDNRYIFSGIDIILIPPIQRLLFFNRIYEVYGDQIEFNLKKAEKGEGRDQMPLKVDYETISVILKDIPFKNAYRVWDIKKVQDVKEIPPADWPKIVYLHTRSIEGTTIEEIYNKNSKI